MEDLMATKVLEHTLVGVYGTPPHSRGNCFSLRCVDGEPYRIVNFVYENFQALLRAGLTFPVQVRVLTQGLAVMHDKRIPNGWYSSHFCEVCCPKRLLPLPQLLVHDREIARGTREERNGLVLFHVGAEPDCLVKPNVGAKAPT